MHLLFSLFTYSASNFGWFVDSTDDKLWPNISEPAQCLDYAKADVVHIFTLMRQINDDCLSDGADVLYNKFNVDFNDARPPDNPPRYANSDYSCVVATTGHWKVSRCNEQHLVVCHYTLPGMTSSQHCQLLWQPNKLLTSSRCDLIIHLNINMPILLSADHIHMLGQKTAHIKYIISMQSFEVK